MKYTPSLPEHNDNVSHRRPLREFLLILVALSALAFGLFWALGWMVDAAVERMSPETEARIHRALATAVPDEKSHDPHMQARLQQAVNELRACAGVPYPASVRYVKSDEPNAAVAPGGHIFVTSGLLSTVRSENGLAFVLAHELAHLHNRDHLRNLGRRVLLITLSTLLTGAHSDLTQILVPADQLGSARHSQARETEADYRALEILNCRFGHVGGATEFFESLRARDEAPAWGVSHYFASHPQLEARLAGLRERIGARGYRVGATSPLPRPEQMSFLYRNPPALDQA